MARKITSIEVDSCEEDSCDGEDFLSMELCFVLDDNSKYDSAYIRLYFDSFSKKELYNWFHEDIYLDDVNESFTQKDYLTITEAHVEKLFKQIEYHLIKYYSNKLKSLNKMIEDSFDLSIKEFETIMMFS